MICPSNPSDDEKQNLSLVWTGNSNYIEVKTLQNAMNLSNIIQTNTTSSRKTEIYATVKMVFPEDDISLQFYPVPTSAWANNNDPRWGTAVLAYSNISSTYSQTAFSKVSDLARGTKLYYTDKEQGATLVYDAISLTDQGPLPQLGINRRDSKESTVSIIQSQANYDISNCQNDIASCNYVKCKLQLKQKEANGKYGVPLKLSEYLTSVTAKATYEANNQVAIPGNDDTELTFVFDKNVLDFNTTTNTYSIPIELTIISGESFESANELYSNYKIELEVSMLITTETNETKKAVANDWLIYTHAKLYTGRVDPAK